MDLKEYLPHQKKNESVFYKPRESFHAATHESDAEGDMGISA